jgi:uncharacterized protein involved in exopolysaccharide biosynthesis/Mrp family chromosome partitioning ATPase
VIRSRAIARRVVDRLNLLNDPAFSLPPSAFQRLKHWAVQLWSNLLGQPSSGGEVDPEVRLELTALRLMSSLSVSNDTRSYLITIAFTSGDPVRSSRIVNAFADEYLRNRVEANSVAAARTSEWLAKQIADTREAVSRADAKVVAFRQETGFVETGADGAGMSQKALSDLTTDLSSASLRRMNEEARLARAKAAFSAGNVPSAQDIEGAPLIQRLLENEAAARRNLADLSLIGPKHPGLVLAKATLAEAQARVREEIDLAIANLESQVRTAAQIEQALTERVRQGTAALIAAKARESELKGLQAEAAAQRSRLGMLTTSYEQTAAAAAWRNPAAQVVVPANPVPLPSGPKAWLMIGLAFCGSLVASVAGVLLLERRDTGLRSEGDVRALDTRCVGIVPKTTLGEPDSSRLCQAAVRQICTSLELGLPAEPQTVLITSSLPGEGKSVFALALAKAVCRAGHRVLVIDWAPTARSDAPNASGEGLDERVEELFTTSSTEGPVLLQPSRRIPVDQLYGTAAFNDLMRLARERFDVIIMEAPAALLVVDFALLARVSDLVLHVVRWNKTPRRTVELALRRIRDMSVTIRGIVLTNVDLAKHRPSSSHDQLSNYVTYSSFYRDNLA